MPLDLTFHVDRPAPGQILGNLCLWEDSWSADVAPWLEAQTVLDRIAHWLRRTALGWPGDRACDLERYLPRKDTLVLYDSAVPAHAQALGRRNLVETGNSYFGGTYITLERAYSRLMGHENRKFVLGFLLAGLNAYIERGWRIREIPQRRQPDSGQDRAETPAPKKRARRRHSTLAAVRKPEEEAPAHHGHTDKPAATRKRC
ncbi:hypothetical protein [uncultured Friedmanniella sp.]|uniref:hypothetical protein n=1 Tax=uncultured Friedmanniella sp. TaxID=335381 RepID=UPI0035C99BF5